MGVCERVSGSVLCLCVCLCRVLYCVCVCVSESRSVRPHDLLSCGLRRRDRSGLEREALR